MTTTTFQNGQVLISSALTDTQVNSIFQPLLCQILGVVADLQLNCILSANSDVISTPLIEANIAEGFILQANGIPPGTTIVGIAAEDNNFLITMSQQATANLNEQVSFYDPVSNTRVKISWEDKGAPGFGITDDVLFIRCVLEPSTYNLRDENWSVAPQTDNTTVLKNRIYTRQWRIAFVAYGPNAFDSVRLIRSML